VDKALSKDMARSKDTALFGWKYAYLLVTTGNNLLLLALNNSLFGINSLREILVLKFMPYVYWSALFQ
jgi:hypothetical protein